MAGSLIVVQSGFYLIALRADHIYGKTIRIVLLVHCSMLMFPLLKALKPIGHSKAKFPDFLQVKSGTSKTASFYGEIQWNEFLRGHSEARLWLARSKRNISTGKSV